ncbi:hypothetical protein CH333_07345 [candidate division WOR-3 bacterium JGI_Cruoil_03_44_89]|uniref:FlgD/Vpr Ig-like domain-containing protein n=1 Tax=candidate division WOR-3 bacterium JGI_Cruoil_03_44_89 TaxID=1973748 RepID=A0A235BNZ4_UNCW3|nr:MAG: hypothetical protein CH333_10360 [candidate division WOR-3 bacterium JGI_Cruoil_03_44_89]OYD14736.1 MAG: hypothetical protein CH333_07345 [candidate division WOR-3 bacterium JGI_Cruoil_03_44_89]
MCKRLVVAGLLVLLFSVPALAGVLMVPEEYATIQAAVDAAVPGDTVSVASGEYEEYIGVIGKTDLTILSRERWKAGIASLKSPEESGEPKNFYGSFITILGSDNITIDGFIFVYGEAYAGGAISVLGGMSHRNEVSHIYILNNVFVWNWAFMGGAIYVGDYLDDKYNGTLIEIEITGNIFWENWAMMGGYKPDGGPYGTGGGVCIWGEYAGCSGVINNNLFVGNYALFTGGAIALNGWLDKQGGVDVDIINNTIVDNWLGEWLGKGGDKQPPPAGGVYISFASSDLINNIIAWNFGFGVVLEYYYKGPPVSITYTDFYGNAFGDYLGVTPGTGCIFDDPLVDVWCFQLTAGGTSFCIDAGNPDPGYCDYEGTQNDMGCYGGPTPLEIVSCLDLHRGWNLTGVPSGNGGIPPYNDPESDYVFGDDFSTPVYMRQFDEPTRSYFTPTVVGPGWGYMLRNTREERADAMGPPPYLPYPIRVTRTYTGYYYGWNLIGNPHPYWNCYYGYSGVHFDSLGLDNVNYFFKWFTGSQYLFYPGGGLDGWIEPMWGIWVQVTNWGDGMVTFPAEIFSPGGPPKKEQITERHELPGRIYGLSKRENHGEEGNPIAWNWRLKLSVHSGGIVDDHNYIGISNDERASSVAEFLLPLDEYVMLYFPDGEVGYQQLKLDDFEGTRDIPVEVEVNTDNEFVDLSWEFEGDVSGYDFYLVDESGETVNMIDKSSYSFVNTSEKVENSNAETALTDPVLLLSRKASGDIRRFNITAKKVCTDVELADFTGMESVAPNPFTTSATLKFALAGVSDVNLSIYDASGRLVRTLVDGRLDAGHHTYRWGGLDENGVSVPSGIYFYKMAAGGYEKMGKLVLLR